MTPDQCNDVSAHTHVHVCVPFCVPPHAQVTNATSKPQAPVPLPSFVATNISITPPDVSRLSAHGCVMYAHMDRASNSAKRIQAYVDALQSADPSGSR